MLIISKAAELEFNSNTWSFLLDVHLINLVDGNSKLGYKRWSNNCFGRKSQNCHNSQDEIMSLTFGTAHINWKCFQSWFYCSPPEEYSGIKGNSIYIESKLERSPACSGGSPPIILFVRKETQNLATPKNFPSLFRCASISCTDDYDGLTDCNLRLATSHVQQLCHHMSCTQYMGIISLVLVSSFFNWYC